MSTKTKIALSASITIMLAIIVSGVFIATSNEEEPSIVGHWKEANYGVHFYFSMDGYAVVGERDPYEGFEYTYGPLDDICSEWKGYEVGKTKMTHCFRLNNEDDLAFLFKFDGKEKMDGTFVSSKTDITNVTSITYVNAKTRP